MKRARFVVEGTWSGYYSRQQRIVHRTVHSGSYKKFRAWAENVRGIRFKDGTMLYITVRDAKPRERVQQINGYSGLISNCRSYGVDSVQALQLAENNETQEDHG